MSEPLPAVADTSALARYLGISRWAVSRALNGQPGVSEETRARVKTAAAQAGFEPNVHARGLRGGTAGIGTLVGVAVPSLRDPVWMGLAGGLCEGLLVRGMQPDLSLGTGELAGDLRVWTRYASRRVLAVLVLGAATAPAGDLAGASLPSAWRSLCRQGVPVIFVEPAWPDDPDGLTTVRSDHRAGAALVAAHLQAAGHLHVGLRGFEGRAPYRAGLLRAAFGARGLGCDAAEFDVGGASGPSPPATGRPRPGLPTGATPGNGSPARRGRSPHLPTALVAADDLTALRLGCELRAGNRTVPHDHSLIGYGDDPAGALATPGLTTLDPQRPQMVARTLELFDELVRDPSGTRAGCLWIAPLLRIRGSVAPVPRKPA